MIKLYRAFVSTSTYWLLSIGLYFFFTLFDRCPFFYAIFRDRSLYSKWCWKSSDCLISTFSTLGNSSPLEQASNTFVEIYRVGQKYGNITRFAPNINVLYQSWTHLDSLFQKFYQDSGPAHLSSSSQDWGKNNFRTDWFQYVEWPPNCHSINWIKRFWRPSNHRACSKPNRSSESWKR